MRTAKGIKYIAIHCSAGFGKLPSIEAFWKSKGWKSPGYHRLIDVDGTVHDLLDFGKTSNGVRGFNEQSINICYIKPPTVLEALMSKVSISAISVELKIAAR